MQDIKWLTWGKEVKRGEGRDSRYVPYMYHSGDFTLEPHNFSNYNRKYFK